MKDTVLIIIIVSFLFTFIFGIFYKVSDAEWKFERSPKSQICYEVHYRDAFLIITHSLNTVDDSYCEDN